MFLHSATTDLELLTKDLTVSRPGSERACRRQAILLVAFVFVTLLLSSCQVSMCTGIEPVLAILCSRRARLSLALRLGSSLDTLLGSSDQSIVTTAKRPFVIIDPHHLYHLRLHTTAPSRDTSGKSCYCGYPNRELALPTMCIGLYIYSCIGIALHTYM